MYSQCMAERSRLASHRIALESQLKEEWNKNQADIYVLERDDLVAVWIQAEKDKGRTDSQIISRFEELVGEATLNLMVDTFELADNYASTAVAATIDAKVLSSLGRDMQRSGNLLGRYTIRPHNGKKYIVFKGNHRLRSVVKGTRYGMKNPTVVKMGIGPDGLKNTAKGGVYVTLFISVGMNTIAWIFSEDFGWKDFVTNVSEDVVKAAIAAVAGYLAGVAIASFTGMAIISGSLGFIVGILVSVGLSDITLNDIRKFAEEVSTAFHRSISAVTNTRAYIKYQIQKVEDAAYCTVRSAGIVIVDGAVDIIKKRVNDYIRSFLPFNVR